MRQDAGRPSSGMRARVCQDAGLAPVGEATTLIIKRDSEEITAQFRYMFLKTADPSDRYDGALRYLTAGYFQKPLEFADQLNALFGPTSELADTMLSWQRCWLEFRQFSQGYGFFCHAGQLAESDPAYQATYWHNHLFNPRMPPGVRIIGLVPDWESIVDLSA